jgi:hypothetical protein
MEQLIIIIQVVIALGIFNVWILRFGKPTSWRGGAASNMTEEFQVYGLPKWSVQLIGFLKILFAACLVIGIWFPTLVMPASVGLAVLMLGAVAMHVKVKDPLLRSLPAFTMLALSIIVAAASAG